ncbi:WRKY transcription factor [Abeliophyllum distichum]|uniref:WRKY transcription factor n=1 Tax=Abeliophyllum distichum TaxID=126358 RepID=A0ABD1VX13_9LAMI
MARPTITVQPQGSMDPFFSTRSMPKFSLGLLTLVSSFFSQQCPFSFSQLLARAMVSPIAELGIFSKDNNFRKRKKGILVMVVEKNNDSISGYKQNKLMNLAVDLPQMQLDH